MIGLFTCHNKLEELYQSFNSRSFYLLSLPNECVFTQINYLFTVLDQVIRFLRCIIRPAWPLHESMGGARQSKSFYFCDLNKYAPPEKGWLQGELSESPSCTKARASGKHCNTLEYKRYETEFVAKHL